MRIIILGAGAGGGLPQWNCGCSNCDAARRGDVPSMTQSSVAVSADGRSWAVINASPDIRAQFAGVPALHPSGPRQIALASVLVTNGDIDHVAGLLTLRESQPFTLFGTRGILDVLDANPVFAAVNPTLVPRRPVALDRPFQLAPGLTATLFAVPGKVPLYLEGETVQTDLIGENTVGVELLGNGKRALYIPGCADLPDWLLARIDGADALLFDATLWTDDEMIRAGLGHKTSRRMGHLPVGGADGSVSRLANIRAGQRIHIHMNNSNPLCDPVSPERAFSEAAGWITGRDGMEISP